MSEEKLKVREFMKSQKLCVVSTISGEGKPESALVAFSETENFEIIFGTFNNTRKYENLKKNGNVSIVIGFDDELKKTIQYEGIALEAKGEEIEMCKRIHLKKNNKTKKYNDEKEQRFFIVKPKWLRYIDLDKEPEEIISLQFV